MRAIVHPSQRTWCSGVNRVGGYGSHTKVNAAGGHFTEGLHASLVRLKVTGLSGVVSTSIEGVNPT